MGELTKRIVWVHINEIREIPITEQYSAYVKLKDFEEMRHEFPFLEKWILLHPEVRSVQVIFEQTLKAQEQWFEKWLGESK